MKFANNYGDAVLLSSYCPTTVPVILVPWIPQWYLKVPALMNWTVNCPALCTGEAANAGGASSETMLCVPVTQFQVTLSPAWMLPLDGTKAVPPPGPTGTVAAAVLVISWRTDWSTLIGMDRSYPRSLQLLGQAR